MTNQERLIKKIKHGGVKSLLNKAHNLGIKIKFFSKEKGIVSLSLGSQKIFIRIGSVPAERRMGDMTRNKDLTKTILKNIGIKTSLGFLASSFGETKKILRKRKLKYPLIVKPIDGSLAKGVTWDIRSESELKKAITKVYSNKSYPKSKKFMVEEMFEGDEYRILVFDGKAISCVRKIPASVLGDGKTTIVGLIEKFNKKRMRGFEIKVDKVVKRTLRKNKLSLTSILPLNFNLKLRHNLNMSDGGRAINCTHMMHNRFKKICEQATKAVGLTYSGIDLLTKDITLKDSPYVIIEINPNPYYNMHEKPLVEGRGEDISLKILKHLFPGLKKN